MSGVYKTSDPDLWRHRTEIGDGYRLEVDLRRRGREVFVEELRVSPPKGGGALPTTRMFAKLRMRALQDELLWAIRSPISPWEDVAMSPARLGRRAKDDSFYAVHARRYVDALGVNKRSPIDVMVDNSDEHTTKKAQLAYVNRARARGLLTAAPPGRAGGELTDKARALLDAIDRGARGTDGSEL